MVEWEPLVGIIPPLDQQTWLEAFRKYQQFPEYQQVYSSMSLIEFKRIFYFEYTHRLLGRFVGLVFFVPLIIFWLKGLLTRQLLIKLIVVLILGGTQGLIGWYMVRSGLIDEPRVSQYRLTAHLGMAVALYGYIVWLSCGLFLKTNPKRGFSTLPKGYILMLIAAIYLMILSGGMVAGMRAGLIWNTFPLMGVTFFPPGLYGMNPNWLSIFEDMTTVQFNHRILAYSIFIAVSTLLLAVIKGNNSLLLKRAVICLFIAICCQIALGIATLLLFVPVTIAVLHQACAVVVFTFAIISGQVAINSERSPMI